ncbi:33630_t:CDS:2, partial [Gigaspora margarita]
VLVDVDLFKNYLQNDIFELNNPLLCNNLEINYLQQKYLDELFNYLEHFNKEFAKTDAHDNTCLKEKAKNLGSFYINQRNVIIGNDIFSKVIKNKMDWYNDFAVTCEINEARIFMTVLDYEVSIDSPFDHWNSLDRDDRS